MLIFHKPPKGDRREVVPSVGSLRFGGFARNRYVLAFPLFAVVSYPNLLLPIWCWIPTLKISAAASLLNNSALIWCWIPTPKISAVVSWLNTSAPIWRWIPTPKIRL